MALRWSCGISEKYSVSISSKTQKTDSDDVVFNMFKKKYVDSRSMEDQPPVLFTFSIKVNWPSPWMSLSSITSTFIIHSHRAMLYCCFTAVTLEERLSWGHKISIPPFLWMWANETWDRPHKQIKSLSLLCTLGGVNSEEVGVKNEVQLLNRTE